MTERCSSSTLHHLFTSQRTTPPSRCSPIPFGRYISDCHFILVRRIRTQDVYVSSHRRLQRPASSQIISCLPARRPYHILYSVTPTSQEDFFGKQASQYDRLDGIYNLDRYRRQMTIHKRLHNNHLHSSHRWAILNQYQMVSSMLCFKMVYHQLH